MEIWVKSTIVSKAMKIGLTKNLSTTAYSKKSKLPKRISFCFSLCYGNVLLPCSFSYFPQAVM